MATTGTRGLRRSSISSKRARRSLEAIEAYFHNPTRRRSEHHTTSEETLGESRLEYYTERSMDKTHKW
jgi:hypothetical protein